jgi:hypothetical protein
MGVISLISPPLFGDAGFGTIRKKKITLQVRQPALVRLANTSIAFTGRSTNAEYLPVQESLLATLSTELLSNEKTLQVKQNPAEANWVFSMDVTGFHIGQPEKRTDNYAGKGASTMVRWTGSLNVAYRISDHSGRVHDADNTNCAYQKDTDPNAAVTTTKKVLGVPVALPGGRGAKAQNSNDPHTTEDVKQAMIKDVVNSIAARLGNTSRALEVQVAAGETRLDRAADFMDKKLWARALEELESGSALPKPEEESYREYDIGLAYEAMAYEPKSPEEQRTNFFKAMEHYDKALELNPKEKYYVETVARARDAVARYKTLETMQREDQKKQSTPSVASVAVQPAPAATPAPATQPPAPAKPKAINLASVVSMVQANVPEDQIAGIIQTRDVEFDAFDPETAIAVAKAGLSPRLQNELRKKVGAPLIPVPAAGAAAKPPVPKAAAPAKKQ